MQDVFFSILPGSPEEEGRAMSQRRKVDATHESAGEQKERDEEVLRANRELAAYFKGKRTEREARAALKTIKAFVRNREHLDPKSRPPMPAVKAGEMPKRAGQRKATSDAERARLSDETPKPPIAAWHNREG